MNIAGRDVRVPVRATGWLLVLVAALACLGEGPSARVNAQASAPQRGGELTALEIKPGFHLIGGAGSNVAVHIGRDGVIVTDTGRADTAEALLAAIRRLTPRPIRLVINTSADADHVGGNAVLSAAGESIHPAGTRRFGIIDPQYAAILAEESVLARMSAPTGQQAPFPAAALPTSTYSAVSGEHQRKLVLSGEAIQVMHQPAAHSDGDSLVYFRRSDVLVTGDVFDATRFPFIDLARGGSVKGVLDSLNRIVEMTFDSTPFPFQEDGTLIVPGHGRLCGTTDVVDYRDMVAIIYDRVADLVKQKKTLDEIQQANPTAGYRRQYGSDIGPWTTAMFVEAIYKDLTSQDGPPR
jgi:glyoxylase-like metal-dependent hydrolase (beta-lactamase superfamily II)